WGRYHGTGLKKRLTQFLTKRFIKRVAHDRAQAQGMGAHSTAELRKIAMEALESISVFLADKPYFGGDRPTTLDATMFGHLAGLLYIPSSDDHFTRVMKDTYPNLGQFVERVKEKYWPDWEETCSTMNMNTHLQKE
ncbi:hypothetical protein PMAYCL1PPCAC_23020, partial [Pristionchus mayeri]